MSATPQEPVASRDPERARATQPRILVVGTGATGVHVAHYLTMFGFEPGRSLAATQCTSYPYLLVCHIQSILSRPPPPRQHRTVGRGRRRGRRRAAAQRRRTSAALLDGSGAGCSGPLNGLLRAGRGVPPAGAAKPAAPRRDRKGRPAGAGRRAERDGGATTRVGRRLWPLGALPGQVRRMGLQYEHLSPRCPSTYRRATALRHCCGACCPRAQRFGSTGTRPPSAYTRTVAA